MVDGYLDALREVFIGRRGPEDFAGGYMESVKQTKLTGHSIYILSQPCLRIA